MSKLSLVAARSPARAALAERIAEREQIAKALRDLQDAPFPPRRFGDQDREEQIERILARPPSPSGAFAPAQSFAEEARKRERVEALLRGETPVEAPADVDPRVALREELENIQAESRERRALRERRDVDLAALREHLSYADAVVRGAAAEVMADEGGRDALIAEYERLAGPAAILMRAIEAASPWTPGAPRPSFDPAAARNVALAAAPCPWAAAAERLRTDPDAPIPTVEAALAAVGGPAASAKNAA